MTYRYFSALGAVIFTEDVRSLSNACIQNTIVDAVIITIVGVAVAVVGGVVDENSVSVGRNFVWVEFVHHHNTICFITVLFLEFFFIYKCVPACF